MEQNRFDTYVIAHIIHEAYNLRKTIWYQPTIFVTTFTV